MDHSIRGSAWQTGSALIATAPIRQSAESLRQIVECENFPRRLHPGAIETVRNFLSLVDAIDQEASDASLEDELRRAADRVRDLSAKHPAIALKVLGMK